MIHPAMAAIRRPSARWRLAGDRWPTLPGGGFDEDDATHALQSAIDSGTKKVVVPNLGTDWNVRPIRLAGDQELVLEQGVKKIVFRNCRFDDNYGDGIEVFLSHQTAESDDVSILFEGCRVTSRR